MTDCMSKVHKSPEIPRFAKVREEGKRKTDPDDQLKLITSSKW